MTLLLALFNLALPAAGPEPPLTEERPAREGVATVDSPTPAPAASWRDRYELGPGDSVNLRFFGRPELDREGVRIAPDGTLSYLRVVAMPAAGLTIDELRTQLEARLSRYYLGLRLIVTPGELRSKRYTILGKVLDNGVFPIDRPITLLEAIARSRGIETGIFEQNTVEIADLDRSFVVRQGRRLPVDFARLYYQGDLGQNVPIEPGDYIYIASSLNNEYYVLGEVAMPGVQALTPHASVVGSISRREGFTARAWRSRVLLVRGSLAQPQAMAVDVEAILQGRTPDLAIEPGDIIYVSERPWRKIEEVLDNALLAFVQSATAAWVNSNVPVLIERRVLPETDWKK